MAMFSKDRSSKAANVSNADTRVKPSMVLMAKLSRPNEVITSIRRNIPISQLSNVRSGFYAQSDMFQHGELFILQGKDKTAIAKF